MHHLYDSSENYLEAIVVLKRERETVRSIDIANHLDLSRPSVSKAMKKLEEEGHVIMLKSGELKLTPSGAAIGKAIDERHRAIRSMLLQVGVAPEMAEEDACKMEHAMSQETFEKLRDYLLGKQ